MKKKSLRNILVIWVSIILISPCTEVQGDSYDANPLIGIKELSEQGKHFEALLLFKEKEGSYSLGDILAVARSSWTLGLISESRKRWNDALMHSECRGIERSRVYLAMALMEFQEGEYEAARSYAEEGSALIKQSELRGELFFVIAESLFAQNLYSLSEQYYDKAVKESGKERSQEALLQLARVRSKLGRAHDARKNLVQIELTSNITPSALEELLYLDMKTKNYAGVRTWIEEGRNSYPSEFRSSKISYQHANALIHDGLVVEAEEEISYIKSNGKDNDPWFQLGRAIIEAQYSKELIPDEE
jgi:tetratricopeptide (TPR) repeat protein